MIHIILHQLNYPSYHGMFRIFNHPRTNSSKITIQPHFRLSIKGEPNLGLLDFKEAHLTGEFSVTGERGEHEVERVGVWHVLDLWQSEGDLLDVEFAYRL